MKSQLSLGRCFGMLSVVLLAIFFGLIIALSAPTAARFALVLMLIIGILVAWLMPDTGRSASTVAWMFLLFGFVTIVWPRLVVLKAGGLPALNPEKLAFVALIGVWVWTVMTSSVVRTGLKQRMQHFKPLLWALALLVVWRIATAFVGHPGGIYVGLKIAFTELLGFYLMLLIGLSVWQKPSDVRPFIWAVVLAGLVVCLMGVVELRVSHNLFSKFVSLDEDLSGRLVEAAREKFRSGKYRVQAGFEHPLVLAEFLVLALPCAIYLLVSSRRWLVKAGMVLTALLFCAIAYKTDSRAGLAMMALMLLLAAMLFAYRSFRVDKSIVGVIIGLLVPALLIALPLLVSLMFGLVEGGGATANASTSARLFMLQRGIPLVFDNPLVGFGVGQGGAQVGYVLFSGLYSIDNHYLGLALDSGLPALLAYLFAMFWSGWRLFRLLRDPGSEDGALAICLFLALVGFCGMRAILSITTNTWLLFALMAAMGTLMTGRVTAPVASARALTRRPLRGHI